MEVALQENRKSSILEHVLAMAIRSLAFVVGLLPPACFVPLGHALGRCIYTCGFRKRVVRQNIDKAFPDLDKSERRRLAIETYKNTCVSLFWFLHLRAFNRWKRIDQYVDIEFPPEYSKDLQRGPVIVTSGHLGCWEILPYLHAPPHLHVNKIVELYRPLHNIPLNNFVMSLRQHQSFVQMLPDKNCLPQLTSLLNSSTSSDIVALLCDQRPTRGSVSVKFLGQTTKFAPGAAVLHERTSRPIWLTALVLQPASSPKPFRLITLPITRDGGERPVQEIMQMYATQLTSLVQLYPSQYLWFHNLWK